jgi:hypothetical protein
MLHPITFSIPQEKIINEIPVKTKILSNLIPGDISTYIYHTEEDYYNEYRKSYFAITTKKGGWDCLRHYEILANGCLPYFINIEECPINTMALWPKTLLLETNTLYTTKFLNKDIQYLSEEDITSYNVLLEKLLDYLKQNLTTCKIAQYILDKSEMKTESKILYLSLDIHPDYLRCLTLHGFKELFKTNCHDYPKIPHIYKTSEINYNNLYGKGFTYTNLLEPSLCDNDYKIIENIHNNYYDLIIYGSYHRGMPYYDLICKKYKENKIILLCGEDIHPCDCFHFVKKGHNVFVREL